MSSESMPPSNPKSAPDAPTEILFWIKRDDNKLPPRPEMRYSNPIRTRRGQALDKVKKKYSCELHNFYHSWSQ